MNQMAQDDIILEAALMFGADHYYEIRNGTLGLTLYIEAAKQTETSQLRLDIPGIFKGLYTIVIRRENKLDISQ